MKELKSFFNKRQQSCQEIRRESANDNFHLLTSEGKSEFSRLNSQLEEKDWTIQSLKQHIHQIEEENITLNENQKYLSIKLKESQNQLSLLQEELINGYNKKNLNASDFLSLKLSPIDEDSLEHGSDSKMKDLESTVNNLLDDKASLSVENKSLIQINNSMEAELQSMHLLLKDKEQEIIKMNKKHSFEGRNCDEVLNQKLINLEEKYKISEETNKELLQKNEILNKTNSKLKTQLEKVKINNDFLIKKNFGPRKHPRNTFKEFGRMKEQLWNISKDLNPQHNRDKSENTDILLEIKLNLEKIYREFLEETHKTRIGDSSIYTINSPNLCAVEQNLNKAIEKIQDKIEFNVDTERREIKKSPKKNRFSRQLSQRIVKKLKFSSVF